jgi:hypothetical protein
MTDRVLTGIGMTKNCEFPRSSTPGYARRVWKSVKTALVAVMLAAAASGSAHAQTAKSAPPELNARAERELRALFAPRNNAAVLRLFGNDVVICGPFLWRNLESFPGLAKQGISSTFLTNLGGGNRASPAGGGPSRTFHRKESVAAFREAFVATYPADPRARIRKLNPAELRLYAAQLPFPVAEPLFVVETAGHKFVVTMSDKLQILAIDDYRHLP